MGIPANPPPQTRLPEKLFSDEELRPYFTNLQEDMYRLWLRSGGGTDLVEDLDQFSPISSARITELELRLGSGDPFTCDETGFTADTTKITCDRTETG